MPDKTPDLSVLFSSIDEVASQLQAMMLTLDDNTINKVPYEGSWTAGMLYRHIIKSTEGIARAMQIPLQPAGRNAEERVPELKKMFLDFSTKMKAPGMIVPEEGVYHKQDTLDKLQDSFRHLKEAAAGQDLNGLVKGLPLGDITKLELVHFILFHSQRHLHQMQKIVDALNGKPVPAGR